MMVLRRRVPQVPEQNRIGREQLFTELTVSANLNVNREELHDFIHRLIDQGVLKDRRNFNQPYYLVNEQDIQQIRAAWENRQVPPQQSTSNDRHNKHKYYKEEWIAEKFSIEGGHLHALLEGLVSLGKIRYLRPDPSKKSLEIQEEDLGLVQEAVLEHLRTVKRIKQQQGEQRPMIEAPATPESNENIVDNPWKNPKGRLVTQSEVLSAFGWSFVHLRNTVLNNKFLPDRRRDGDWYYWFWSSDILFFLSEHGLRKADVQKLTAFKKSLTESLREAVEVTATFPPLQQDSPEQKPEPPTPAQPKKEEQKPEPAVSSSVQIKEGLELIVVSTAAQPVTPDPLTKIDPRARPGAMETSRMMQYMYEEAGVLDVPGLKKKIVRVSIELKFDNPDLMIPLCLSDFGIDVKNIAPITMWTIEAPTVEKPEEISTFQVVLVNGTFRHINQDAALEAATKPETSPEEESANNS